MEQRLKTLEDLCELITKEVVHQNKNMIEINKNLLSEIKSLREAYIKQDDDFEEFKNLLRKIYELNRQNSATNQLPLMFPTNFAPQGTQTTTTSATGPSQLHPQMPNMNNSLMADHVNQSMLNNLSFQSERTPLNQHNLNPNNSNYSVPSSAAALQQQQQFMPFMPPQQPVQVQQQPKQGLFPTPSGAAKPSPSQPHVPSFNPAQPPPTIQVPPNLQQQQTPNSQMFPSTSAASSTSNAASGSKPFSFSNLLSKPADTLQQQQQSQQRLPNFNQTTSTPQPPQFSFSKLQQPPPVQPAVNLDANKLKFQLSPAKPLTTPLLPAPTSTTTIAAPSPTKPETKTSLFGSDLFKTTTPEKSKPLFGGLPPSGSLMKAPEPISFGNIFKSGPPTTTTAPTTFGAGGDDEDHEGGGGATNPEEFEPQVEFKPIVKLHEVEVKTGEEDEDVLFKTRCKLFRFDSETKEWKEKGVGEIKFLKNKQTKVIRILMRRDQVLKLCANHRISPSMTIKEMAPKQLSWLATDFSDQAPSTEMLLAKFKTVEDGNQFKQEFEKAVVASKSLPTSSPAPAKVLPPSNKPSLSDVFKNDKWKCNACYAPNNNDVVKCACCGTLKPGATAESTVTTTTSTTSGSNLFSFGTKPNESPAKTQPFSFGSLTTTVSPSTKSGFSFGQATTTQTNQSKISFGSTQLNIDSKQPQSTTKPTTNLFGQPTQTNTSPQKPLFQFGQSPQQPQQQSTVLFDKPVLPSFASLAAKSDNLFGTKDSQTAGFTGGLQPTTQPPKPLFGGSASANAFRTTSSTVANEDDEGAGNDQNPEEYEPQIDFKPLVKLQEVEVKTGEEDEIAVFKQRCKLYRYESETKEWKEKGTGEMKILKHKENEGMYRILMRRDQVLKLCANHRITSDLKFEIYNDKQVRWHAQDYSDNEGKHETLAARFKNEEDAKNFVKEAEEAQKNIQSTSPSKKAPPKPAAATTSSTQPSLSDVFKNDKWKCNACYAPNNNDVVKCACCGTLKPGATEPTSKIEQTATSNLAKISLGSTQPQTNILFGTQPNQSPAKFEFGSKPIQPATTGDSKPLFGASTIKTEESKPLFQSTDLASVFGNKPSLSFSDLANQSKPSGFGGGFIGFNQGTSSNTVFGNLGKAAPPVFGSQTKKEEGGDEEAGGDDHGNPEEYEPQVEFKPLVKLHEVEVKTGEEDEEILFKARCKLFRFNTESKEWKEKGVGDIKILKHKVKENSYRVLMRREQVLKLCANHRINPSLKLEVVNEKQLRWFVTDCSEEEPHPELLLAKFRADEDAKKFREEFENAQQVLAANPKSTSTNTSTTPAAPIKNNLASALKQTPGTWSCSACLSQNKPESDKCAACQTPKPGDKNNNDISIIEEVKANPDQVKKAREFKLPDNFYLYEHKPECAGCRGCEKEE